MHISCELNSSGKRPTASMFQKPFLRQTTETSFLAAAAAIDMNTIRVAREFTGRPLFANAKFQMKIE